MSPTPVTFTSPTAPIAYQWETMMEDGGLLGPHCY